MSADEERIAMGFVVLGTNRPGADVKRWGSGGAGGLAKLSGDPLGEALDAAIAEIEHPWRATQSVPGSVERIAVYAARAATGESLSLCQPGDRGWGGLA